MGNAPLTGTVADRGRQPTPTLQTLDETRPLLEPFDETAFSNLQPATELLPSHDGSAKPKPLGPPRVSRSLFWVRVDLPGLEQLRNPVMELAFRKWFFEHIARKDDEFHLPPGAPYDEAIKFANEYLERLCECGIDIVSICAAVQLSSDEGEWLGTSIRDFITDCVRGRTEHPVSEAELRQAADHVATVAKELSNLVGYISTDWLHCRGLYGRSFDQCVAEETYHVVSCARNRYGSYQQGGPIAIVPRPMRKGKYEGPATDLIEPKALAFMRLMHCVASEYLEILRSSKQVDHAILAAKAAVAIDTANTKYFPDDPRIPVDDIMSLLEGHAQEARQQGRTDELAACHAAIRSLAPLSSYED